MPGFHTAQQFEEFIHELDEDQTRIVLLERSFHRKLSQSFPAASVLDHDAVTDYIDSHYKAARISERRISGISLRWFGKICPAPEDRHLSLLLDADWSSRKCAGLVQT